MRKIALLSATALMTVGLAVPAAQAGPPCADVDGDGAASGREYAQHHIVEAAHAGMLGNDGHKPGSHHGFSLCNPSGK